MTDPRAVFSGLKAAKGRSNSNYVRPGHYWAVIDKIKVDENRKSQTFMAIEMSVVRVLDNEDGKGHRLGEQVTHMLMTHHDSFMGNVKTFISRVMDVPEIEVDEEAAIAISDESQPLRYTVCEFRAVNVKTKAGNDFTQIDYSREVPLAEVVESCDHNAIDSCFPAEVLTALKSQAGI